MRVEKTGIEKHIELNWTHKTKYIKFSITKVVTLAKNCVRMINSAKYNGM